MLTEEERQDLWALSNLPMLSKSMREVCAKAAAALSASGEGVTDAQWLAACLAYERVTEYPYNRDAIRAAIEAALRGDV